MGLNTLSWLENAIFLSPIQTNTLHYPLKRDSGSLRDNFMPSKVKVGVRGISGNLLNFCLFLLGGSGILFFIISVLDKSAVGFFLAKIARWFVGGDPIDIEELAIWSVLFLSKLGLVVGGGGGLVIFCLRRFYGQNHTDAILTNLVVFGIVIVILFISSEFTIRYVFRDITSTPQTSFFTRQWRIRDVLVNKWRFRERDFPLAKPKGIYRIAVIGDSLTYGQGIAEEARFTNLVEGYLNEQGKKYEVLNFGRSGTETDEHIEILRDFVFKIDPDYILLQWFVNDFEGNHKKGRPQPRFKYLLPHRKIHYTFNRLSGFYYLSNQAFQRLQKSLGLYPGSYVDYMNSRFGNPESEDSRKALQDLNGFISMCKNFNVPIGIVLFPHIGYLGKDYPFDYLHDRVLYVCSQQGISCIDMRSFLTPYAIEKNLWANRLDSHPGPIANHLAAEQIMKTLGPVWISGT